MGQPAAKQGDQVIATDIHIVLVPTAGGPVPVPLPHPFTGILNGSLSNNVNIMGCPAATVGSTANNIPSHLPSPPGTAFQMMPQDRGSILIGSPTVNINGRSAARNGDTATTCNDPADLPVGTVVAVGTVLIG